jgi:hypothetical protein
VDRSADLEHSAVFAEDHRLLKVGRAPAGLGVHADQPEVPAGQFGAWQGDLEGVLVSKRRQMSFFGVRKVVKMGWI